MSFEIREVCGEDAAQMLLYNKVVGSETDFLCFGGETFNISEEKEAKFLTKFKNSQRDVMLVALDNGKIVGNAALESERIARYSHRTELSITVLKDYWGQGIGSALMERLISFAKSKKFKSIFLDVRADNTRAISLYEKFGFVEIGKYEAYFKINGNYYDAKLMVLYL